MIDAEDVLLVESPEQNPIELLRREQIVTEGFFNDNTSTIGAACLGEPFHDEPEERRRDGKVMRWPLCRVQLLADGLEGSCVFIVTVNIAQQAAQLVEGRRIDPSTVFLDTVSRPLSELIEIPTCFSHPNNRHIEMAPFDHRLERRKDFLVGEIARGTEEHQCIRKGRGHALLLIWRISPDDRRNQNASPKAACRSSLRHHATRNARTKQSLTLAPVRLHR